jgi:hypothetical protein
VAWRKLAAKQVSRAVQKYQTWRKRKCADGKPDRHIVVFHRDWVAMVKEE